MNDNLALALFLALERSHTFIDFAERTRAIYDALERVSNIAQNPSTIKFEEYLQNYEQALQNLRSILAS